MISGLLGKKIGMTHIFDKDGNMIPVTVIQAGPCPILELKDVPVKVKIGFDPVKESRITKPLLGIYKKAGVEPRRVMREFRSSDNKDYKIGQEIKADLFKPGDFVDIIGTSIGKGFQGGMKRWNWHGGPATRGSMHHRRVGSIGRSSFPGHVVKGQHMPGHMGDHRVTIHNLRVMDVDVDKNIILCKGAVPGAKNAYLCINLAFKKKFRALDEVRVDTKVIRNPMKQSKAAVKGKGGK